jgi:hypothetical protein
VSGGFGALLHAEWTKFRTVRGWVAAVLVAVAVIVLLGLAPGMSGSCGRHGPGSECSLPVGPDGTPVSDSFFFVHRPLAGDGSITVRVASLTGVLPQGRHGVAPWAKAGLIIKASTRQGSAYAAVMLTGGHGVRMQYDYTHDAASGVAGRAGAAWLRLTRTGDTVTGYQSRDGAHWTAVGTARLSLPATVQAGLFATSPQYAAPVSGPYGAQGAAGGPSQATGTFDHLGRRGAWPGAAWTGTPLGGPGNGVQGIRPGWRRAGGRFSVTGSGDIAPAVSGPAGLGTTITQTLVGTFAGLIVVVVVGTMFVTTEYRRGLIRTTLAAGPRRGRLLAAKALVVAAVSFLVGLVAAAVVVTVGQRVLRDNGVYVHAVGAATELRVMAGTGALLAASAVLALAIGTMLRRSATAVAAAVVVIVLPYLLAVSVLPLGAARWLLRVTPAAAFAVQQSLPQYAQVDNVYAPADGYFPLPPWAGFGVLCGWAALAMTAAVLLLRRRDA